MLFDDTGDLVRIIVVGVVAYIGLVAGLRVSGKRTLAQMNAFDLVVTVAMGSTLATVLLSSEVSLSEGILALTLLIGMQYSIAWVTVRWKWSEKLPKSEPTMLVYRGELIHQAMRSERVSEAGVLEVLRLNSLADRHQALAVVLESNGTFSVVPLTSGASPAGALANVSGVGQEPS